MLILYAKISNLYIFKIKFDELEFSLKHNAEDLLNKSDVSSLTIKEINLIKLLLCSGLYPNIAIADEANYYRKLQEQTFHTSSKR